MSEFGGYVDEAAMEVERTQALVDALHLVLRTLASHGGEHPLAVQAVQTLEHKISAAEPPFTLQFVGKGVFKDGTLVPINIRCYRLSKTLADILHALSVHELAFDRPPDHFSLLDFATAVANFEPGAPNPLDELDVPGLTWREIPQAQFGVEVEEVDPEVFCTAQLTLAIADAELLVAHNEGPWNWGRGVAVTRRLERALDKSPTATARALEVAPGIWSPARRSVAACCHLLTTLGALDVERAARRAAAHALLVLGCIGLEERDGADFEAAGKAALGHVLEAPALARTGVEPHRAKTCALVHMVFNDPPGAANNPGVIPLLHLCYELERRRCPGDVEFDLTLADLLAAACEGIQAFAAEWVQALVSAYGVMPPGARVRLPDGLVGIVLETGEHGPLRPLVLVQGVAVVPTGPVQLIPPTAVGKGGA